MIRRIMALFLILVTVFGLLPGVALAEETDSAQDPAALAAELNAGIRTLPIPVNQKITVNYGNSHELSGTYFMVAKSGSTYYALNHAASVNTKGVLHRAKDSTTNRPQTAFSPIALTVSGNQVTGQTSLQNTVTLDYWREPIPITIRMRRTLIIPTPSRSGRPTARPPRRMAAVYMRSPFLRQMQAIPSALPMGTTLSLTEPARH